MPRLFPALLVTVALALPLTAAEPDAPIVPAKDPAELEQRLAAILKEHHTPGLGAVIASREGLVWTAGVGLADVAAGTPVTPDTLFRIGSISKTFAALAALRLVEQGRLDLQAPVRSLVPDVEFTNPWEATHPVRVVHLLEHTTGWEDIHFKEYADSDPTPATLAQALALCPRSRSSRWRPGTRFAYCNSGPAVTAAIVEKLTGQRFEEYVEETLFRPIGMPTADYFLSARTQGLLTKLYHEDGKTPYPYWHIAMRPSGAINASAREMGACLRFLLRRGEVDGRRVLSEASLQRMETPTTAWGAQGGLKTGYGLHNFTSLDDRGFVWHGHNGGVEGGLSVLAYLPEAGLGYFFSMNGDDSDAEERIDAQMQAYVTRGLPRPELPPARPLDTGGARDFQGWYVPTNNRFGFADGLNRVAGLSRVSFEGDRMHVELLGLTLDLVSVGDRQFRMEKQGAAGAVLVETGDGRVLALGSGAVLARVSPAQAWLSIACSGLFVLALLSVPLFALVWVPRRLLGRLRVPNLHVRVLPALAVLSLGVAVSILVLVGNGDTIRLLGHLTPWSASLTASTWAFAGFSCASLWAALRAGREGMNRWAYLHSLGTSAILVTATLYLAWWGVIGYRSWI
jgi:CubicO group peptidase (beta-lactamase class C family)